MTLAHLFPSDTQLASAHWKEKRNDKEGCKSTNITGFYLDGFRLTTYSFIEAEFTVTAEAFLIKFSF